MAEESSDTHWVWAWNGVCFGYRRGDSLFTLGGIEVGRFSGAEVYGVDGKYVGEVRSTEDGDRLITGSYKKSCTGAAFVPTFERAPKGRPLDRPGQPLYCGYEDFPLAETDAFSVFGRKNRARRHANANQLQ
jgi:hypothetical protein